MPRSASTDCGARSAGCSGCSASTSPNSRGTGTWFRSGTTCSTPYLIRHLWLDLFNAREDPVRQQRFETGYIIGSVVFYTLVYLLHRA
jgi:hypothetical protein